jgi:signal transduction histidine kinase/CHASE2 domain-containing sensor protein
MTDKPHKSRRARQIAWVIAIIVVSALAGMTLAWRAPGFDLYARDGLMRSRGRIAPPDDIVIIAIDEASIARFGRFPWPRALMANALDRVAATQPKAIALDVLYSEPTPANNDDDQRLAAAIVRAGNVIAAAQLIGDNGGARPAEWLRPLPEMERAAAGVGHVNVLTESDGAARGLLLLAADDEGRSLWAMAVETVRIGDRLSETALRDLPQGVAIGARIIPVRREASPFIVNPRDASAQTKTVSADRMTIDYIGPTGSFAPRTYSFAEIMDGRVSAEVLRGSYVLIGATAATLGEQIATPFVHDEGADRNQHGALMPGVEVLANSINTILRARFYRETPDWLAALCAALVAAATLALLAVAHGRFEIARQLGALGGLIALILTLAYVSFAWGLIVPPLIPMLVALATAAPLGLLRRSLAVNVQLDARIAELTRGGEAIGHPSINQQIIAGQLRSSPAAMIAELTEAEAVTIFVRAGGETDDFRLAAAHGAPVSVQRGWGSRAPLTAPISPRRSIAAAIAEGEDAARFFSFERERYGGAPWRAIVLSLGEADHPAGALVIAHSVEREPEQQTLRLCVELAASYLAAMALDSGEDDRSLAAAKFWRRLSRGGEWKARMLGVLNRRALAHSLFVDRALRSVEDGLIVAGVDGRIVFVNPRAAVIFNATERALMAGDLFDKLREIEIGAAADKAGHARKETLVRLIVERSPIEREITIGGPPARHYTLRLSPVCAGDAGSGAVLGLVASLSDITRQRELQQIKSDVMALVTHELRTPLTAIQGMSEVLAQFEVDADRRRKLHLAINDEAKRLMRMINDYLDITRLESGATGLRRAPVHLAPLIERTLLLVDPVAAQRDIRILRRFAPGLPPLLADAELLARAVTNLVANAIKYSPAQTEVFVELRADIHIEGGGLRIEVTDRGPGIPAEARDRVFEKFYRVPRLADADVPGTGLGLALVREVAELHGGRVTVESEQGVGSTFTLRLPFTAAEE